MHVPETRVQVVELNVPVELVVKLTVPVGVPAVELTVTVQVEGVLSRTLFGAHVTEVVDAVGVTARRNVPLLPVWTLSPA